MSKWCRFVTSLLCKIERIKQVARHVRSFCETKCGSHGSEFLSNYVISNDIKFSFIRGNDFMLFALFEPLTTGNTPLCSRSFGQVTYITICM